MNGQVVTYDRFEEAVRRGLPDVERVLPHDLDAERSILGTIVVNNDAFDVAATVIDSQDFYRDANRRIFEQMASMRASREPIDFVTLKAALQTAGQLDDCGGAFYVGQLADGIPAATNVSAYAKIVKGKATLRILIETGNTLVSAAYDGQEDPAALARTAQEGLQGAINARNMSRDSASAWRLIDDVELMELPSPGFIIEHVLPDQAVVVVVAPPGLGKTTLATDFMVAIAADAEWFGHKVLMPGSSIYVAAEDPSGFKLRVRARKQAARLALERPLGIYTFPEALDMRDEVSVARFSDFLAQAFEQGDVVRRLLVIDTYAASNPGASENSSEDTTLAMTHAQQWRDRLGVTVLLIHHTNAAGTRERGHSAMRGAADCMISMTQNDDVVIVECSKQRNGAPFEPIHLKLLPAPGGDGCVFRLASDVLPGPDLSVNQAKAYAVLKDTFDGDGCTKSEWQRSCLDIPERTFHRVATVLCDKGLVTKSGVHYRLTAPVRRGAK